MSMFLRFMVRFSDYLYAYIDLCQYISVCKTVDSVQLFWLGVQCVVFYFILFIFESESDHEKNYNPHKTGKAKVYRLHYTLPNTTLHNTIGLGHTNEIKPLLTRKHSQSSNPRRIAVNPNHNVDLWPFNRKPYVINLNTFVSFLSYAAHISANPNPIKRA